MRWRMAIGAIFGLAATAFGGGFELTILHTNDLHAHAEPVTIRGKTYGGYARQASLIRKFKLQDRHAILLNGGDTFQGTLYFNVYEGLSDVAFMNEVGYQAMSVGNHEFDRGPSVLAEFVKRAKFPVLAANLDVSNEPALKGLIQPSTVIKVDREQIGVVGAVTPDLPDISAMGDLVKMKDLVASVQAAVDDLKARKINKIILVSHCGYGLEQELAQKINGLDVVVGGHSHSLLAPSTFVKPDGFPNPLGDYPTVVQNPSGSRTLVLQDWEWGKVFGRIKVQFDGKGQVSGWHDGSPIVVDESVPEDPVVAGLFAAFQKPILATMNQKIGETKAPLERGGTMQLVVADAMLEATRKFGAVAAFINVGGVRAGLEAGPITLGKVNEVQPFRNTLTILELSGAELKAALETPVIGESTSGGLLIPSEGTRYDVDMGLPSQSRVLNVMVAGAPLDLNAKYKVALLGFTASGGDAHTVLKAAKGYRYDTGLLDIDALSEFIKQKSPLNYAKGDRVKFSKSNQSAQKRLQYAHLSLMAGLRSYVMGR